MSRIAFLTIGLLKAPRSDPRVADFMKKIALNFEAAERSPGFIDRSRLDSTTGVHSWGIHSRPATFPIDNLGDRLVETLSLWQTLASVAHFAYRHSHADALSARDNWFVTATWPQYVAWWVDDAHTPSWPEGYERFDLLHLHGASPLAFDFKRPFDVENQPMSLTT